MNIRFLSPTVHGVADYLAAAGLLILPFVLVLGISSSLAKWLAVAAGVAVVVVSLLTDYTYGAIRLLPFRGHLAIETIVAIAFALAPSALGFAGIDAWYYWVNAAAVFLVVGLTRSESPRFGRSAPECSRPRAEPLQPKAERPVIARPRIRAWMSFVPS
jgi:hypothetical protein